MMEQFLLIAKTLYRIENTDWALDYKDGIMEVMNHFLEDINSNELGYPLGEVSKKPYLEEFIHSVFSKSEFASKIERTPTIILSHDIDYIYPTFIQHLKRIAGRRDFNINFSRGSYLESLEKYLEIDSKYGSSTLFLCLPEYKRRRTIKELIINPSYKVHDRSFHKLKKICHKYSPEIGVHGSINSLENETLTLEREKIQNALELDPIVISRQHWLRIDNFEGLVELSSNGIKIDSSLAWNGQVGYRCGMSRPYPLVKDGRVILWEVPMLLMDGVLFDELKLTKEEAYEEGKMVLDEVFQCKGAISLNWHARTYAKDYNWGEVYSDLLSYAKKRGFEFKSFSEVVNDYKRTI